MREVIADIERWRAEGLRVATARVVGVEGSGPRAPGATMAVAEDGRVAGSVSGGCVESAVVTEALEALASGGCRVVRFGYADDEALAVGLTCGGSVTLLVSPSLPPVHDDLVAALGRGEPVVLATVTGHEQGAAPAAAADRPVPPALCFDAPPGGGASIVLGACLLVRADGDAEGGLGAPDLDRVVARDALGVLSSGESVVRRYGSTGRSGALEVEVFLEAFVSPPRMLVVGAVDFAAALARQARLLGYRVTVCDARAAFATAERFPMADEVVAAWPQRYLDAVGADLGRRDAVCVLTHEARFDVPAIVSALRTAVGYIGALGSRRTTAERRVRLLEAGVSEADLARVMAPIGLDLGARTPQETALAICAEIVALQTGRRPGSLSEGDGPVHQRPGVPIGAR